MMKRMKTKTKMQKEKIRKMESVVRKKNGNMMKKLMAMKRIKRKKSGKGKGERDEEEDEEDPK